MNSQRILLVEDNPDDVHFLRRAFGRIGMTLPMEVAEDGQKAVDVLESSESREPEARPTRVLLDLKLPRISGLEVLAWIRSRPRLRELPVIVLTSSNVKSDADQARALGVDDFHVKPISARELEATAQMIVARWGLPLAAPKA